ncbi:MAG: electron transfer flavoprotein subunit beta/FixA family protein [Acidimicrobiia bacterium]|nr:electron transfer flavoprotein subunit beta/FixA family protein [Acidimicrobiia bacterium]
MRIVVCVKEVLDPDAVGAYAVAGRLEIDDDGRLAQTTIPRLINGYDEQALEAALRLRDAGLDCEIRVVSVATDAIAVLRHASSLGADEVVAVEPPEAGVDCHVVAALLAGYLRTCGGADLVLCGRQASDDDQGVVPALLGELLGLPVVTVAREVAPAGSPEVPAVRVTRVTPDGDEVVEAPCPSVVTISSELGAPRYPTMPMKMAARRVQPTVVRAGDLGLSGEELAARAVPVRQFVPAVKGDCELVTGSPTEAADRLVELLVAERVLQPRQRQVT